MSITTAQLDTWMSDSENEHLEFKEARGQYSADKLTKYCSALANEGGGKMILGVTDKKPRKIVGTSAFGDLNSIKARLVDRLKLHVEVRELFHPNGRVLAFEVPPRPIGMPIPYQGSYYMRAGEDLIEI